MIVLNETSPWAEVPRLPSLHRYAMGTGNFRKALALRCCTSLVEATVSAAFMLGVPARAQTFIPTTAPMQNWIALASSADGVQLAAAGAYGLLYTSTNAGATWSVANTAAQGPEPQRPWQGLATSADGRNLVAVASFTPIFLSADYGQTWTTNGPAASWAAVAWSDDGAKLVVVDYNLGGIYTSTDSGANWTLTSAPAKRWRCVASSADGARLAAGTDFGADYGQLPAIYISEDSGATWKLSDAPGQPWQTIASSADGTKLAAGVYGGLIYLSADAGAHWTPANTPSLRWGHIAASADGTRLLAAAWEGKVYVSSDSGRIWTPADAPDAPWQTVAVQPTAVDATRRYGMSGATRPAGSMRRRPIRP